MGILFDQKPTSLFFFETENNYTVSRYDVVEAPKSKENKEWVVFAVVFFI